VRRLLAVTLGVATVLLFGLTIVVWGAMENESRLFHEVGDDTPAYARMTLILALGTLATALSGLVVWQWPTIKRQWAAEATLLRDMRK
jgi:hypothetical protein